MITEYFSKKTGKEILVDGLMVLLVVAAVIFAAASIIGLSFILIPATILAWVMGFKIPYVVRFRGGMTFAYLRWFTTNV